MYFIKHRDGLSTIFPFSESVTFLSIIQFNVIIYFECESEYSKSLKEKINGIGNRVYDRWVRIFDTKDKRKHDFFETKRRDRNHKRYDYNQFVERIQDCHCSKFRILQIHRKTIFHIMYINESWLCIVSGVLAQ